MAIAVDQYQKLVLGYEVTAEQHVFKTGHLGNAVVPFLAADPNWAAGIADR